MALVVKNLSANAGDVGLIPGLGRSPGGGHDNPLQYSCLGNPMDRDMDWWATVPRVTKESDRTERLSTYTCNPYQNASRFKGARNHQSDHEMYMEMKRTQNSQEFFKGTRLKKLQFPIVNLTGELQQQRQHVLGVRTDTQASGTGLKVQSKPIDSWSNDLWQRFHSFQWGKDGFSINGAMTSGYSHTDRGVWTLTSHHTQKLTWNEP